MDYSTDFPISSYEYNKKPEPTELRVFVEPTTLPGYQKYGPGRFYVEMRYEPEELKFKSPLIFVATPGQLKAIGEHLVRRSQQPAGCPHCGK